MVTFAPASQAFVAANTPAAPPMTKISSVVKFALEHIQGVKIHASANIKKTRYG
ncbi:MAG: hypothetical protein WBM99_05900 [Psychromonas sp.]